jgi:hypothetical protein
MSRRKQEKASRVAGSEKARRYAAVILEVFAGLRGTNEASEAMGVSPNRYYELEARGLKGLVAALEPLPRGRQRTKDDEIEDLGKEKAKLEREVVRLQSLVRAARKSIGIPEAGKPAKGAKAKGGTRRRRPSHRGKKVVALLRKPKDDGAAKAS